MILFLVLSVVLPGCTKAEGATVKNEDYHIECISEVLEKDCCICGANNRSLMDYYRKSEMIGLVCLNTMSISSLDTRPYSNDGKEILEENAGHIYTSHGEGECSFAVTGMPSRGILEAEVNYGEQSVVDFEKIKEFLCQKCIDKVIDLYEEEMSRGNDKGRFPEVCLVDFATNELYTLGQHSLGYWIRDFWVHIDHQEEGSDIMVIYAPEDKMEGYKYANNEDIEEISH